MPRSTEALERRHADLEHDGGVWDRVMEEGAEHGLCDVHSLVYEIVLAASGADPESTGVVFCDVESEVVVFCLFFFCDEFEVVVELWAGLDFVGDVFDESDDLLEYWVVCCSHFWLAVGAVGGGVGM